MTAAVVILSVLLVISLIAAASFYRKADELRMDLTGAVMSRTEISNFLSRFSAGIDCDDGLDGALHSSARYVCEQIEAGSVAIYGVNDGRLSILGVCGEYPLHTVPVDGQASNQKILEELRREIINVGDGFIGSVAKSRHGELVPLASVDDRFAACPEKDALGSIMAVPMSKEGIVYGVICAVENRMLPGKPFSNAQYNRLKSLSAQVLMVQQLVQVYGEISRRERIDQELAFVRQFQNSLLPPGEVTIGDFSVCARTTSAKEVNGDFFDMVKIDENRLLVMVGDACGKGMPACILASMTRSFARAMAAEFTTLTKFLRDVNANLNRDSDADRFITMGCCLIDKRGGLIEFGRAGHTDMIMHVHDHLRRLSPRGTALGMLSDEDAEFDTICLAVDHGSSIMLFSDGLSEALNHDRQEFGTERLANAFHVACDHRDTPNAIIDEVMTAVHEFEYEQNDDQTMIVIHRPAAQ
ncbi:MAG: SpoIIE family protein phosphatase [Lentisphaeria bacterium]|nr:SpoIIE family protein phosphatase [Lentisphaeria bacterium]